MLWYTNSMSRKLCCLVAIHFAVTTSLLMISYTLSSRAFDANTTPGPLAGAIGVVRDILMFPLADPIGRLFSPLLGPSAYYALFVLNSVFWGAVVAKVSGEQGSPTVNRSPDAK